MAVRSEKIARSDIATMQNLHAYPRHVLISTRGNDETDTRRADVVLAVINFLGNQGTDCFSLPLFHSLTVRKLQNITTRSDINEFSWCGNR